MEKLGRWYLIVMKAYLIATPILLILGLAPHYLGCVKVSSAGLMLLWGNVPLYILNYFIYKAIAKNKKKKEEADEHNGRAQN